MRKLTLGASWPPSLRGARLRLARFRAEFAPDPPGPAVTIVSSREKHAVTPGMLSAARELAETKAPAFRSPAGDGLTYALDDLKEEGPLVLVFIKDSCPCSQAAQPFYNRLHDAYGAGVRFFGVIDGDARVAARWAKQNRVNFPILSDPELSIVHEYKAENSAYFAIIATGGTIEKCWPGYSAPMLREVSQRLARLAGVEERPTDAADAPDELYSGCPY